MERLHDSSKDRNGKGRTKLKKYKEKKSYKNKSKT